MWYSSEFICVSPRHVSTPALSPGAVSLHLRHRLWHRHNPGYLESCIPLHTMRSTIFIDIRYPMHIPWTCRKLNLDHLESLKHLEWDLDEKPRNRLTTPAVTWVWTLRTLTYLDIHRHHPARHHLTSPDITWGSPAAADNKKRAAKFHAPPATGLSWVENLLTVVATWLVLALQTLSIWILTLWTGTLSTCRTCPPSPYFFFPILNFHRPLQINNYCMKSESSDSSNLFRLWKILTAYAKDAKNADKYSCRMSANAYYSWLFPNSFHPSLDCCGSLVRGTTAVSNQAPGAGIITESALAMIDHEPNESSCDQAGGWWAQRSTLRINL